MIDAVRHAMTSLPEHQRRVLAAQLEALLHPEHHCRKKPKPVSSCPRCACHHIVKKGYSPTGGQRYLCKGCHRTFGASTHKVLGRTRLSHTVWTVFMACFVDGLTIRQCAKRCGVSVKTAFFMRHRLLEIVEQTLPEVIVGAGNTAVVDETFFPYSCKGSRPVGRKARKRGKSIRKRGLSGEQVCVMMGTTSTGEVFHRLAGCGTLSRHYARWALGDVVKPGAHIVTDKATAYRGLFDEFGASHTACDATTQRAELVHINTVHSKAKRFIRRFNGVATKYLSRYLAWMVWLDRHDEDDTLAAVHDGLYAVPRSAMTSHQLVPMDTLARLTVTQTR